MAADRPSGRLRRPAFGLTGALVVLTLLVLLAASVLLGLRWRAALAEDARDEAIKAAARRTVMNFVSIDYRHVDRDLGRITHTATGQFEKEYSARTGKIKNLITKFHTVSQGDVMETGIVTADDDSATVLVVADAHISNTEDPKGKTRYYRMKLSLVREADDWLTSQLEFVG